MKEVTFIFIIVILMIVIFALIIALVYMFRIIDRASEKLQAFDDYLLTKMLINEREKQDTNIVD